MNRYRALRGGADVRSRPGGLPAGSARHKGGLKYAMPVRMAPVRALGMRGGETYE